MKIVDTNLLLYAVNRESPHHAACRACDSVVYDYLAARAEADGQDPRVLRLFDGWMRANLDWHVEGTGRYREHLSVATGSAEDDRARANGTDT